MGWFSDTYDAVRTKQGEEFTFQELGPAQGVVDQGQVLRVDEDYLTITVRSSRIVNVRQWATKFHAAVHARVNYLHLDRGTVEFQALLAPSLMKDLDKTNLDHVVKIDAPVIGPVPYRGGVALELGLFSVGAGDLAGPYIELLKSFAAASGTGFVAQAAPFMAPLGQGLKLLFGDPNRSVLEIGLEKTWTDMHTGTWLLMRAPAGSVDLSQLKLNSETFRLLDRDGRAYRAYPYVVIAIQASEQRPDWMTIPDLKQAYDDLRKLILKSDLDSEDDRKDIDRAFKRFEMLCKWSPDLVPADHRQLVEKVAEKLPRRHLAGPTPDPGEFETVRLYG